MPRQVRKENMPPEHLRRTFRVTKHATSGYMGAMKYLPRGIHNLIATVPMPWEPIKYVNVIYHTGGAITFIEKCQKVNATEYIEQWKAISKRVDLEKKARGFIRTITFPVFDDDEEVTDYNRLIGLPIPKGIPIANQEEDKSSKTEPEFLFNWKSFVTSKLSGYPIPGGPKINENNRHPAILDRQPGMERIVYPFLYNSVPRNFLLEKAYQSIENEWDQSDIMNTHPSVQVNKASKLSNARLEINDHELLNSTVEPGCDHFPKTSWVVTYLKTGEIRDTLEISPLEEDGNGTLNSSCLYDNIKKKNVVPNVNDVNTGRTAQAMQVFDQHRIIEDQETIRQKKRWRTQPYNISLLKGLYSKQQSDDAPKVDRLLKRDMQNMQKRSKRVPPTRILQKLKNTKFFQRTEIDWLEAGLQLVVQGHRMLADIIRKKKLSYLFLDNNFNLKAVRTLTTKERKKSRVGISFHLTREMIKIVKHIVDLQVCFRLGNIDAFELFNGMSHLFNNMGVLTGVYRYKYRIMRQIKTCKVLERVSRYFEINSWADQWRVWVFMLRGHIPLLSKHIEGLVLRMVQGRQNRPKTVTKQRIESNFDIELKRSIVSEVSGLIDYRQTKHLLRHFGEAWRCWKAHLPYTIVHNKIPKPNSQGHNQVNANFENATISNHRIGQIMLEQNKVLRTNTVVGGNTENSCSKELLVDKSTEAVVGGNTENSCSKERLVDQENGIEESASRITACVLSEELVGKQEKVLSTPESEGLEALQAIIDKYVGLKAQWYIDSAMRPVRQQGKHSKKRLGKLNRLYFKEEISRQLDYAKNPKIHASEAVAIYELSARYFSLLNIEKIPFPQKNEETLLNIAIENLKLNATEDEMAFYQSAQENVAETIFKIKKALLTQRTFNEVGVNLKLAVEIDTPYSKMTDQMRNHGISRDRSAEDDDAPGKDYYLPYYTVSPQEKLNDAFLGAYLFYESDIRSVFPEYFAPGDEVDLKGVKRYCETLSELITEDECVTVLFEGQYKKVMENIDNNLLSKLLKLLIDPILVDYIISRNNVKVMYKDMYYTNMLGYLKGFQISPFIWKFYSLIIDLSVLGLDFFRDSTSKVIHYKRHVDRIYFVFRFGLKDLDELLECNTETIVNAIPNYFDEYVSDGFNNDTQDEKKLERDKAQLDMYTTSKVGIDKVGHHNHISYSSLEAKQRYKTIGNALWCELASRMSPCLGKLVYRNVSVGPEFKFSLSGIDVLISNIRHHKISSWILKNRKFANLAVSQTGKQYLRNKINYIVASSGSATFLKIVNRWNTVILGFVGYYREIIFETAGLSERIEKYEECIQNLIKKGLNSKMPVRFPPCMFYAPREIGGLGMLTMTKRRIGSEDMRMENQEEQSEVDETQINSELNELEGHEVDEIEDAGFGEVEANKPGLIAENGLSDLQWHEPGEIEDSRLSEPKGHEPGKVECKESMNNIQPALKDRENVKAPTTRQDSTDKATHLNKGEGPDYGEIFQKVESTIPDKEAIVHIHTDTFVSSSNNNYTNKENASIEKKQKSNIELKQRTRRMDDGGKKKRVDLCHTMPILIDYLNRWDLEFQQSNRVWAEYSKSGKIEVDWGLPRMSTLLQKNKNVFYERDFRLIAYFKRYSSIKNDPFFYTHTKHDGKLWNIENFTKDVVEALGGIDSILDHTLFKATSFKTFNKLFWDNKFEGNTKRMTNAQRAGLNQIPNRRFALWWSPTLNRANVYVGYQVQLDLTRIYMHGKLPTLKISFVQIFRNHLWSKIQSNVILDLCDLLKKYCDVKKLDINEHKSYKVGVNGADAICTGYFNVISHASLNDKLTERSERYLSISSVEAHNKADVKTARVDDISQSRAPKDESADTFISCKNLYIDLQLRWGDYDKRDIHKYAKTRFLELTNDPLVKYPCKYGFVLAIDLCFNEFSAFGFLNSQLQTIIKSAMTDIMQTNIALRILRERIRTALQLYSADPEVANNSIELFNAGLIVDDKFLIKRERAIFALDPNNGILYHRNLTESKSQKPKNLRMEAAEQILQLAKRLNKRSVVVSSSLLDSVTNYQLDFPDITIKSTESYIPLNTILHLGVQNNNHFEKILLYDNWRETSSYTNFCRLLLVLQGLNISESFVTKLGISFIWPTFTDNQWIEKEIALKDLIVSDFCLTNSVEPKSLSQNEIRDIVFGFRVLRNDSLAVESEQKSLRRPPAGLIDFNPLLSWAEGYMKLAKKYEHGLDKYHPSLFSTQQSGNPESHQRILMGTDKETAEPIPVSIPSNLIGTFSGLSDPSIPIMGLIINQNPPSFALIPQFSTLTDIFSVSYIPEGVEVIGIVVNVDNESIIENLMRRYNVKIALAITSKVSAYNEELQAIPIQSSDQIGVFLLSEYWNYNFAKSFYDDSITYTLQMSTPRNVYDAMFRVSHFTRFWDDSSDSCSVSDA